MAIQKMSRWGAHLPIKIYLLDEWHKTVATGALGELHIGGAGLARGYFNRTDLTAERFGPDPFCQEPGARIYKSGDMARYWPDGNIEFAGRVDNQVKFHGFRVELDDIRNALNSHPQVRDSVVVIARDKNENDCLVAYYVGREEVGSRRVAHLPLEEHHREDAPERFRPPEKNSSHIKR